MHAARDLTSPLALHTARSTARILNTRWEKSGTALGANEEE